MSQVIIPLLNLLDAVKASSCFYSGFFVLKYMMEKRSDPADVQTLVTDFCDKYKTALPQRAHFIKKLISAVDVNATCMAELDSDMNHWFDPIDPIASITKQEICNIHSKLIEQLEDSSSVAEHVSMSYIVTLNMFLQAN